MDFLSIFLSEDASTTVARAYLALVTAVFKDYEEISYEDGKLTLRRKSKT